MPEQTFQVGDVVRCISLGRNDYLKSQLSLGDVYTLVKVPLVANNLATKLDLRNDKGQEGQFLAKYFEKVGA
jgi:hypothetical protein